MLLLRIAELTVAFRGKDGTEAPVVEDLTLDVARGASVGLVGESGCGKSVTARTILRLLPEASTRVPKGAIFFEGEDALRFDAKRLRLLRGGRIGMVFQEPMTSLNPTYSIGFQIDEAMRLHGSEGAKKRRERARELLAAVGIANADQRLSQYPFELSGGLRQRAMIAMALANGPALLIADEPTTALDVTIQAQILELLKRLRKDLGMALLLISHDLGVVAEVCEKIYVMYAGRIVEETTNRALFDHPRHPYTVGLLAARPQLTGAKTRLTSIPGQVPPPGRRSTGCAFAERCQWRLQRCESERPVLQEASDGSKVACWNPRS